MRTLRKVGVLTALLSMATVAPSVAAGPPSVSDAYATSDNTVRVQFDRAVQSASATTLSHYGLTSARAVVGATMDGAAAVVLTVSGALAHGTRDDVLVQGVAAADGSLMPGPQSRTFLAGVLSAAEVQAPSQSALLGQPDDSWLTFGGLPAAPACQVPCTDRSRYTGLGGYLGERLTISGIVIAQFGTVSYLADSPAAFRGGVEVVAENFTLTIGHRYRLACAVAEDQTETRLENVVYVQDQGAASAPAATTLAIDVATNATCDASQSLLTAEDYEGRLVRLANVKVTQVAGGSFQVAGPSPGYPDTLTVVNLGSFTTVVHARQLVNVTGILSEVDDVYRLLPRSNGDLEVLPTPPPSIPNFYTIKTTRDSAFSALASSGVDLNDEGSGYSNYNEWLRYWWPRVYPSGVFPVDSVIPHGSSSFRVDRDTARPARVATGTGQWTELGPLTMSDPIGWGGTGRLCCMEMDPTNSSILFAGSQTGGLYRSTDAGVNWSNAGTDHFLGTIGVQSIAIDLTNPATTWFISTGNDQNAEPSTGIYRTTDGGATWYSIADAAQLGFANGPPWGWQIYRLLIDPSNHDVLYAATSAGIYQTSDLHATAPSWTLLPTGDGFLFDNVYNDHHYFYDIEFKPDDSGVLYAAGDGIIWRDGSSAAWAPMPGSDAVTGFGTQYPSSNIMLAVTPHAVRFLYALVSYHIPTNSPFTQSQMWLFDKTTSVWTAKGQVPAAQTGSYEGECRGVSSSRLNTLRVSPTDENLVFLGDVFPAFCTNGATNSAATWVGTGDGVHPDIHAVRFSPDGATVYAATDGGVFVSTDAPSGNMTWHPRFDGLGIANILGMSGSVTNPALILLGNYDTGTSLFQSGGSPLWKHVEGGDGLQPLIDRTNASRMWASSQGGHISRSTNGGTTWSSVASLGSLGPNWSTYYVQDSGAPLRLFAAGTPPVLRTNNGIAPWTDISGTAAWPATWSVWQVFVNPGFAGDVYASVIEPYTVQVNGKDEIHYHFHLFHSYDAFKAVSGSPPPPTWSEITLPADQWVSCLAIDGSVQVPPHCWMALGGGIPGDKVYELKSGVWNNISGSLPNISASSIVKELGADNRLYVGVSHNPSARVTVYYRDIQSSDWIPYADNLPNVSVNQLEINAATNRLRAGTYGRGLWESPLAGTYPTVAGPDGYLRDNYGDTGIEPDDVTSILWESPDVWVRNDADQLVWSSPDRYQHENMNEDPRYNASNQPWVYAKVGNRGKQTVSGTVQLYWAQASTGLDWPGSWDGSTASGEIVGSQLVGGVLTPPAPITITLDPGQAWVVARQWTDIPDPNAFEDQHFCLLARFVSNPATADPINGEAAGSIWDNVHNSNNIAWKNEMIIGMAPFDQHSVAFKVRNFGLTATNLTLRFSVPRTDSLSPFTAHGNLIIDLGSLYARWVASGSLGQGIAPAGGTRLTILSPYAAIAGLSMAAGEEQRIATTFTLSDTSCALAHTTLTVDLSQYSGTNPHPDGGEHFQLKPQALPCESNELAAGPNPLPVTLALLAAPNPVRDGTTFFVDLPRPDHVVLRVFDISGRAVRRMADGEFAAGRHTYQWDLRSDHGETMASGVYLAVLRSGSLRITKRIVVLR